MDFPLSNGISKPRKGSMKARLALALPLLSLLIFGTVIGARLVGNATSASAASLVPLSGQIPSVVKSSTVPGSTDPTTQITVVLGLRLRNQDGLAQYIKDTSQAKERVKRSMTPNQLIMAYAPLPSSQQAVINYMQQFGFHTTQTFNHHLLVGFSGTVAQAQRAFHIQINNYRSLQGKTFYAPAVDPSIPAAISPFVQNISGLDSAFRLTHAPVTGPAQKQLQPLAKSSPQTSTPNYCL